MEEDKISDFTIEVVTDYTEEFINYIADLCDKRSKELKELNDNYTAETMRRCFKTGRFAHGFFIIKRNGEILITFGIDDFKRWGVIARYLVHQPGRWQHLGGLFWPFVYNHTKDKVVGICSTHNVGHRKMIVSVINKLMRKNINTDNPTTLIELAAKLHKHSKVLDFKVMYRGTVQEVATYYTDLIPPFDRV